MRRLDQRPGDLAVEARQADVQAGREEEIAAIEVQVDLSIYRHLGRELDLPMTGGELDRAHVTGRPGGAEQILRRRVGLGQLDVQETVAAVGGAVMAVVGVGLAGEENLRAHGRSPFGSGLETIAPISSGALHLNPPKRLSPTAITSD